MVAKGPHILIAGLLTSGGLSFLNYSVIAGSHKNRQPIDIRSNESSLRKDSLDIEEKLFAEENSEEVSSLDSFVTPPMELQLRSNRQSYDARRKRFLAEGQVSVLLNEALLKADRIEFDRDFKTLIAIGRVRFKKGSQYFQASSFYYNIIKRTGELKDVYGVIDLENLDEDLKILSEKKHLKYFFEKKVIKRSNKDIKKSHQNSSLKYDSKHLLLNSYFDKKASTSSREKSIPPLNSWISSDNFFSEPGSSREKIEQKDDIACPPDLPPTPNWRPSLWSLTAWGGQMTNADFGEAFIFDGARREEYLFGIGLNKRIYQSGPFAIELGGDLFRHQAKEQAGGSMQPVPFASSSSQEFYEGVIGIGARLWIRPWLNIAFIEGISYNTSESKFELTNRNRQSQLLNYIGAEIEAFVTNNTSIVGRIHHRSGAFGTFSGVEGGSNAYLLGFRYRWGDKNKRKQKLLFPPPNRCYQSLKASKLSPITIDDGLEVISVEKLNSFSKTKSSNKSLNENKFAGNSKSFRIDYSKLSFLEKEEFRKRSIALVDQRIYDLKFKNSFGLQGKMGIQKSSNVTEEKNKPGGIEISQLSPKASSKIISGSITRWRIQSPKIKFNPKGWSADRMSFTNDPFTPTQTRIDAYNVVAQEDKNTDILITSSRSRLIIEDSMTIPIVKSTKITRSEQIKNRWVFGIDQSDRDGVFFGRALKPILLGGGYKLSLQPQFLLQRAIINKTNSYVAKGDSVIGENSTRPIRVADLFGLKTKIRGDSLGFGVALDGNISTFNPDSFLDGSRYWANAHRSLNIPILNKVKTNFFGAYRDKVWNGSIGETEIYTAYGGSAEKIFTWDWSRLNNTLLLRAGFGRYQAEILGGGSLAEMWRTNLYSSMKSKYTVWQASNVNSFSEAAYRYSPIPVVPGLTFDTNFSTAYFGYEDGNSQKIISFVAGPTITFGTFTKPFLDYTKLSVFSGASLKQGGSPFSFDEVVDLATLGVGLTQQIAGPLILKGGIEYNIDGGSDYYGKSIKSNIELRWQRRSYDIGIFYNPDKGIGGISFHLNDFNFNGTGIPFIPYTSSQYLGQ